MSATLHFHDAKNVAQRFRTGVSLHSHTCYSKETLGFVYRYARDCGVLDWAIRRGTRQYRERKGGELDLCKAYWTPPVAPVEAAELEAAQIRGYDLHPIVSLTDHDTIGAPLSLRALPNFQSFPLSVEWTVPYRGTFFHLGIHNLPAASATQFMAEFAAFSASPVESRLDDLLPAIAEWPEALVVLNHPCWDEKGFGKPLHRTAAMDFVGAYGEWLHAVELNGLRPWNENREVVEFSRNLGKPLISGGDRHGLEPNAILNFTNAESFAEFASEVRAGYSEVVLMPSYGHAFRLRLVRDLQDLLSHLPGHGLGWHRWDERVFYEFKNGEVRSFADIFGARTPFPVNFFVNTVLRMRNPIYKGLLERIWGQDDAIDLPEIDDLPEMGMRQRKPFPVALRSAPVKPASATHSR